MQLRKRAQTHNPTPFAPSSRGCGTLLMRGSALAWDPPPLSLRLSYTSTPPNPQQTAAALPSARQPPPNRSAL
eukprot:347776-Chlamydomonas_euryale.AAC.2